MANLKFYIIYDLNTNQTDVVGVCYGACVCSSAQLVCLLVGVDSDTCLQIHERACMGTNCSSYTRIQIFLINIILYSYLYFLNEYKYKFEYFRIRIKRCNRYRHKSNSYSIRSISDILVTYIMTRYLSYIILIHCTLNHSNLPCSSYTHIHIF